MNIIRTRPQSFIYQIALCLLVTAPFFTMAYRGPVYDGPELDYQPAIIRVIPAGTLMLVFERINPANFFGDLYVCFSSNNGESWSTPQEILSSPLNQRHPALVQLAPNSYALFYLVDESGSGAYRIHRATSTNGTAWTGHGAVDLGWASPGEINPCVILESGGTLTMTYHRLSGPAFIARSDDGGATWDLLQTRVSDGNGALPRLARRQSDGHYLVTYQTGSSSVDIWAKVSADPYDWSAAVIPLSTEINSHDSQPIVLEDGTFLVAFARQNGSVFDLYYKTSPDGMNWSDAVEVFSDTQHYDTQPHPLLQGTPGHIILTWSHQESASPYVDHDVWIDTDLTVSFPPPPGDHLVTGPGAGVKNPPLVRIYDPEDTGTVLSEWSAYGVSMFGVNVACGNLDDGPADEVLTGPGPGSVFAPHVRAFDSTGVPVPGVSFMAYGTLKFGVNVASGDIDGDGYSEIVTGPGPGAVFGPHVRGWNVDGTGQTSPIQAVSFMAYGTRKWGANAACGDLDEDGTDEIVTGPGPGAVFGPHVRGWNYDGGSGTTAIPGAGFMAYGTRKWGVNVACGDLDGDGRMDLLTGAGPGLVFAAHVRGWVFDGSQTSALPGVSFFAYEPSSSRYGAMVGSGDVDGDGIDEILTMPGRDPFQPPVARAWNVDGGTAGLIETIDFDAYGDMVLTHGGKIAGGGF
jgi:hypothetical protein